jgi:hypothetical protein
MLLRMLQAVEPVAGGRDENGLVRAVVGGGDEQRGPVGGGEVAVLLEIESGGG